MHFDYKTSSVCAQTISFDLDDGKVKKVKFSGGCNGNLKAISKLVDGMEPDRINEVLAGNTCSMRSTSCADQLAKAVMAAKDEYAGSAQ